MTIIYVYFSDRLGSRRRLQTELGVCELNHYFGSTNFGTGSAGASLHGYPAFLARMT